MSVSESFHLAPKALVAVFTLYAVTKLYLYIRADRETRRSMRQAARIKRRWRRLAPALGLSYERRPGTLSQMINKQLAPERPADESRTVIPRIKTKADPYGVTVFAGTLPKVGLSAFEDAAESLRDEWDFSRLMITQERPGVVRLRGLRREPLAEVIPSTLVDAFGRPLVMPGSLTSAYPIHLFRSENGRDVYVDLRTGEHVLIAGRSRSGKSRTANNLLAHASLMRDVRLVVIDPNVGAVAPWWRTAHTVCTDTDPTEPTRILKDLRREMEARDGVFWSARTDRITDFSEDMPLILVVIDEVANYTSHPDKKKREAFDAELRAVAAQGIKYGLRLLLITQKPSADVLSTAIRTNLSGRVCHQVDTVEDYLHLFPDARDLPITAVDRTMPPGVAVASMGAMRVPERVRAADLSAEACWVISDLMCEHGWQVRELPGPRLSFAKEAEERAA